MCGTGEAPELCGLSGWRLLGPTDLPRQRANSADVFSWGEMAWKEASWGSVPGRVGYSWGWARFPLLPRLQCFPLSRDSRIQERAGLSWGSWGGGHACLDGSQTFLLSFSLYVHEAGSKVPPQRLWED